MKQMKAILWFITLFLLASLACNAGGRSLPDSTQANQAATQAAQLAATAASVASQSGDVAATTQAMATMISESGNIVATIQAMATAAPVSSDSLQALQQRFANVQMDGNGNATVTLTDVELTQAIQAAQAQAAQSGQPINLQNAVVIFSGGNIMLAGDVTQPVQAQLVVTFRPYVQNNTLQFEVTAAQFGQINVPPSLLDSAEASLNNTLSQAMGQLPAGVTLQEVTMGEGTMTVIVRQS